MRSSDETESRENPPVAPERFSSEAFTIIELAVIIAVLAVLICLVVPAMAKGKTRSPAAGCLSNLRQLQLGWAMYADDFSGALMANAPAGSTSPAWCPTFFSEGWSYEDANTNRLAYLTSLMAPYVSSNLTAYRCPGDVVPSDNGVRLRSYSMNGQMGTGVNYNSGWRNYFNESDLNCPLPKDAFIFCDEHPGSINDGYFQVGLVTPVFQNVPASYLEGGCGFSFGDGHAEIHKWETPVVLIPVVPHTTVRTIPTTGSNADWLWLRPRTACNHP